ncbi:prepilin-type N-terminal cleavage/methylation domain-containing protein [Ferrimonas sediminum]|uniref:Prepilin-type N-terminal cleavage/methylation domain-containing protein n=1 Tax=Ferrimonas sediminum TaxID=718193 RepID=A0A1G8MGQ8_9GAMM|nr:prepilin-type N-terminal cleavage/methylation domain-containing protein [Ferrimonas sediminum]SDI67062.1 prepilin-type N-terminal cleavage/methylation domain-containing protein [Ferrimonas sediminum]
MNKGFTLIELVVVLLLLAITAVVAAPRFIDLSSESETAVFETTFAAFHQAVNQSHLCWRLRGGDREQENLRCSDDAQYNSVDYNAQGFPVGSLEGGGTKSVGNEHDCLLLWDTILDTEQGVWSASDSRSPAVSKELATYRSEYTGSQSCRYTLLSDTSLRFHYNSLSGEVLRL